MTQQYDPTHTGTAATISGSPPLVMTQTGTDTTGAVALCTEFFTSGLYYFEMNLSGTAVVGSGYVNGNCAMVGVGNISATLNGFVGIPDANSIGIYATGPAAWYSNGASVLSTTNLSGAALTAASGLVCVAWNATSNKIWARFGIAAGSGGNVAGYWNGDSGADPVAGLGGALIPSAVYTGGATPVGATYRNNGSILDIATAAFAVSSWQATPPSGFGPFDPTASAHNLSLLGVGNMIGWRAALPLAAAWKLGSAIKQNESLTRRSLLGRRR